MVKVTIACALASSVAALGYGVPGGEVSSDPAYTSDTFSPGFRRGPIYGLRPSLVVDTRFKTPASDIISTANDLARFAIAVFGGRLVTDTAAKDMFSVTPDSDGRTIFTAGWTIDSTRSLFEYNGSMEGATAFRGVSVPAGPMGNSRASCDQVGRMRSSSGWTNLS